MKTLKLIAALLLVTTTTPLIAAPFWVNFDFTLTTQQTNNDRGVLEIIEIDPPFTGKFQLPFNTDEVRVSDVANGVTSFGFTGGSITQLQYQPPVITLVEEVLMTYANNSGTTTFICCGDNPANAVKITYESQEPQGRISSIEEFFFAALSDN